MPRTRYEKVYITKERVKLILKNRETPNKKLKEQTGLPIKTIEIIRQVQREGLRGWQSRN